MGSSLKSFGFDNFVAGYQMQKHQCRALSIDIDSDSARDYFLQVHEIYQGTKIYLRPSQISMMEILCYKGSVLKPVNFCLMEIDT